MFLIHVVFQQYVFCIENDGKVSIERINSDDGCCPKQVNINSNESELAREGNCSFCTDFSAIEKFGDTKSHSVKQIVITAALFPLTILSGQALIQKQPGRPVSFQKSNLPSAIEAYKTVSLLI
jgi:hypothetical protein